jgi:class 3 adenylate cyclase
MATEQFLKTDRRLRDERSTAANGRADRAVSHRSTTLRPGIGAIRMYVDAIDARHLPERLAYERLVIVPGSERELALNDCGATAVATSLSADDARYRDTGRFLTTVLMTDIVDSTLTVTRLGDGRWRELLAGHYADCRTQVAHRRGQLVNTTGDGIVAIFDAPTRAVRTAIAIQARARELGIAVRAGIHSGECARLADGIAGVAVHIAARICALGGADEVMTTGTVRDLAIGSMLAFEPRGHHELRGVPGEWPVFGASDPT